MNGIDEDLQEHDELVDCGGVWMVGQVDVLVEQACDVGIPNGFHVPRRTCKASLGRRDAVDQHKCRNSFEVLNRELAIEESEVWVNKVDVVGEKLTRLSAMTFNEADVKKLLASAVEIAKAGNRIVLEADGGYIENAKTGEKMKVDVDKNVYVYQVQMDDGEMIAVTLDSGAGCNVWPRGLKAGSSILKPPKKGLKMIAANGTPISYLGQRLVKFRGLDESTTGFCQADVSMIEREGDRNALNVVRPDGGHFPGGVCDENVSLEQDGQENVEMTIELCGEEFCERKPKKVQDPKLPSPEEVLVHNFSHLPYRSWSRHCVRGRCKENPHRRVSEEPKMSEVHFDFGFLGKEDC